jgi:dTDP-D-glucose 4,6-dehydratase
VCVCVCVLVRIGVLTECLACRTMHGTGMNTRNFLFVEDVARAFDVVLHKGEIGNVYNIGGTNEFPNIEVARKLLKEMGKVRDDSSEALAEAESELITWAPDRPFNDGTCVCVCLCLHRHVCDSVGGACD